MINEKLRLEALKTGNLSEFYGNIIAKDNLKKAMICYHKNPKENPIEIDGNYIYIKQLVKYFNGISQQTLRVVISRPETGYLFEKVATKDNKKGFAIPEKLLPNLFRRMPERLKNKLKDEYREELNVK